MKFHVFSTILILTLMGGCASEGGFTPAESMLPGGKPVEWKLVWSDEFTVDGLPDNSKWNYDIYRNKQGWHNDELQYYSRQRPENAKVEGGKLIITARNEKLISENDYGGQHYSSARLLTRGKASWTYGFFEVRAKLPCGLGTWPAIWTLGMKGPWPENGEIDIMEHVGKAKGEVLASIHTKAYNWKEGTQKSRKTMVPDICDNFHNYQLTWNADRIRIGVDDKDYFEFEKPKNSDRMQWPFDDPQHLLLNLAIGGGFGGPVDNAIFPVQMEVDYVRVYQP